MAEFAVTAIGKDRPGIVAALSGALLELEGNITDSQMSILRGHFAVMLVVELPDAVGEDVLAPRVGEVGERLGLEAVAVSPIDHLPSASSSPSHVLSVYGADHPGIVHRVTSALAELGANVTDLETRVCGGEDAPVYVMLMELALAGTDPDTVRGTLEEVGADAGVEVSLRELDAEIL